MPVDPVESLEDENVDRRIPKSMRKTYTKRSGPVAARTSSHQTPKPLSGLHRRHRRRYGV